MFGGLIKLMRPKQWVKNCFVLAPLVFSSRFLEIDALVHSVLAAIFFCIASSAAYIVNDIRDKEKDQRHPTKSVTRPLAAGIVSVRQALILLFVLYIVLVIGAFLFTNVILVISAYILLNVLYTLYFKNQPVLDIFCIATGFVLRIVAGSVAIGAPVSAWMAITTLCLALYLAAIKRRQELSQRGTASREVLRKYTVELIDRFAEMSATGALVFYSMFVMSSKPELNITVPVVLFGIFRYWYVVEALEGGESPTDALLADWQLILCLIIWSSLCIWTLLPK
jgi:decaprenyl-phosphate phosphoribosyltransferase